MGYSGAVTPWGAVVSALSRVAPVARDRVHRPLPAAAHLTLGAV